MLPYPYMNKTLAPFQAFEESVRQLHKLIHETFPNKKYEACGDCGKEHDDWECPNQHREVCVECNRTVCLSNCIRYE